MKITIYTKGLQLTPDLKSFVEEKIGKIGRFLDDILEAKVELDQAVGERSGNKFRAEVMFYLPKELIRAVSTASDIKIAVDLVIPKLKKQVEVYKTKYRKSRTKRGIKEDQL